MPYVTLMIAEPILSELRRLQVDNGRSLSEIVSDLLTEALARRGRWTEAPRLNWDSQSMGALVDLSDKEAIYTILDSPSEE